MSITSKQIYNSIIYGAYEVIKNKDILNKINVFPVQDGDTGSNLASMMRMIVHKSEPRLTVKETLVSIADAAIDGARGNSGIIFAQYLYGLSETMEDGAIVTIEQYAKASKGAAKYAYASVGEPVEGTMLTVMKEWGNALLDESIKTTTLMDILNAAFKKLEIALEKTKEQLAILTKADVVDAGAKGFTCFIEGVLYYIRNGNIDNIESLMEEVSVEIDTPKLENHSYQEGYRYCTECLLEGTNIDMKAIKDALQTLGNSAVIAGTTKKCRIHIHTNSPVHVFDVLYHHGTVIYQKVDDMLRQENIVKHRNSDIALVTDSIADIPKDLLDTYQIHMIHLEILFNDMVYMDKLTIHPYKLLETSKGHKHLPTSSQPSSKQIEYVLDYLSTYYKSVIIMTVSKELSGTYNNFVNTAKDFKSKDSKSKDFKISVINTKQNSGAQGILVKKCAEFIHQGLEHDEVVEKTQDCVGRSKILVQVKTIDNMIKSGRLSVRAGKIAKIVGLKPIVTLDSEGKGALDSIAFSSKGSNKKLIKHIKKLLQSQEIEQYNIVHVNNPVEAEILSKLMVKAIGFEPEYIEETSSIVAVGAGQGAVALSYLLKKKVS